MNVNQNVDVWVRLYLQFFSINNNKLIILSKEVQAKKEITWIITFNGRIILRRRTYQKQKT